MSLPRSPPKHGTESRARTSNTSSTFSPFDNYIQFLGAITQTDVADPSQGDSAHYERLIEDGFRENSIRNPSNKSFFPMPSEPSNQKQSCSQTLAPPPPSLSVRSRAHFIRVHNLRPSQNRHPVQRRPHSQRSSTAEGSSSVNAGTSENGADSGPTASTSLEEQVPNCSRDPSGYVFETHSETGTQASRPQAGTWRSLVNSGTLDPSSNVLGGCRSSDPRTIPPNGTPLYTETTSQWAAISLTSNNFNDANPLPPNAVHDGGTTLPYTSNVDATMQATYTAPIISRQAQNQPNPSHMITNRDSSSMEGFASSAQGPEPSSSSTTVQPTAPHTLMAAPLYNPSSAPPPPSFTTPEEEQPSTSMKRTSTLSHPTFSGAGTRFTARRRKPGLPYTDRDQLFTYLEMGEAEYKCIFIQDGEVCGKVNSREARALDHVRSHLGVKPYICDGCPKASTGCGARYSSVESLRGHQRKHCVCPTCGRTISYTNYPRHRREQHAWEPAEMEGTTTTTTLTTTTTTATTTTTPMAMVLYNPPAHPPLGDEQATTQTYWQFVGV
ncbi:hypothetical protein CPB86DRAFT_384521 [Serendipita vermifera]|nr:hypothetical protein CPB86DRAFT_384521 [Serendipita vermifera]